MYDQSNESARQAVTTRTPAPTGMSPAIAVWGILSGLTATAGYSLATAFLRQAAHDPPIWVSTIKAACTAAIFLPWLIAIAAQGRRVLPPARLAWMLVGVSVFVQIGGNVLYQVALAKIGMALAVPLTLGAMVFSSAIMGRVLMGEPLSPKIAMGLAILIAAIAVLSFGAKKATGTGLIESASAWTWFWGALASIISGFAYAVLGVGVRQSTKHNIPLATPIVFVSVIGTAVLGGLSLSVEGVPRILAINGVSWFAMIAAGVLNGLAFLALAKSLKILPVVYVNAINTLQMLASAFIGLYWFVEPWTYPLTIGLILNGAGLAFLAYAANELRKKNRPLAAKAIGTSQSAEVRGSATKNP